MKQIPLTKGQFAIVDDEDFEELSKHKWYAQRGGPFYYAARRNWKTGELLLMHRVVMQTPKGMVCDHINHNTLDNRKHNLRNCLHKENLLNTYAHKDNSLGIKCISLTSSNTYCVRLSIKGKIVFRKKFKTLGEAIRARDEQFKIYHGIFTNTGE